MPSFIRVAEEVLSWSMRVLCFLTGMALAITVLAGVLVRYVIQGSLAWSGELPAFLFPWFVMGGATLAALKNQHLGFDYIVDHFFQERWRSRTVIGVHLLVIAALLAAAVISLGVLSIMHGERSPVLGLRQSWSFASMPVGLVVLALGVGIRAVKPLFEVPTETKLPLEG